MEIPVEVDILYKAHRTHNLESYNNAAKVLPNTVSIMALLIS